MEQWQQLITAGVVSGVISIMLMIFMIASYLIVPLKRVFPSRVIIYQFISIIIFDSTFGLFGVDQHKTVWCAGSHISTQSTNGKCALQGVFVTYGSLALGVWWIILSFNLFLNIVLEKKVKPEWEKYYLVAGWGFPLVILIAALGISSMEYAYGTSFCFIHGDLEGFDSVQYPLYYLPMGLYILVSSILLGFVVIKIARHIKSQEIFRKKGERSTMLSSNIRLLMLCLYLLFLFTWIFGYRFYIESNTRDWYDGIYSWVSCRLQATWGFPGATFDACPFAEPPELLIYSYHVGNNVIMASIGVFMFLIFGSDKSIYKAWYELFIRLSGKLGFSYGQTSEGRNVELKQRPKVLATSSTLPSSQSSSSSSTNIINTSADENMF
jgi:hypothetical protein